MSAEESLAMLWEASSRLRTICNRMYGQHNSVAAEDLSFDIRKLEHQISDIQRQIEKYQDVIGMAERSLK